MTMRKEITAANAFRCLILSIFLCGHAAAQIPMESTLPGMKKCYRICKRNGKPAGYALSEVVGSERNPCSAIRSCARSFERKGTRAASDAKAIRSTASPRRWRLGDTLSFTGGLSL